MYSFWGRKGPFEPTNEVLVAVFSHHSPGPDHPRQFNLAWSRLEIKSLKHEFPRKRWSHSATLLEAKGDDETYVNYNNDELVHTICIYGGRNNSEVFDDLFFLNIYCDQYANDRKTVNTSVDSMPSDGDGISSKKTCLDGGNRPQENVPDLHQVLDFRIHQHLSQRKAHNQRCP